MSARDRRDHVPGLCAAPSIVAPSSCRPEIMLHAGVTAQQADLDVREIVLIVLSEDLRPTSVLELACKARSADHP